LLIVISKLIRHWYIMLIITELLITFHSPRIITVFPSIFSPNSQKLHHTFFNISHPNLHQFASFFLDPCSTRLVDELFCKSHAKSLIIVDFRKLGLLWCFANSCNWSCFELRHAIYSPSWPLISICFDLLDLESAKSTSAIIYKVKFDFLHCMNLDMAFVELST
jgi:hypothetical protein